MNEYFLSDETRRQLRVLNLHTVWPVELVVVSWPDGERVYGWHVWQDDPLLGSAVKNWLAGRPYEARFDSQEDIRLRAHKISRSAQIGDDEIQMVFSDLDGKMQARFRQYGSSVPVKFYLFFPQNGTEVERFSGRISAPEIPLYGSGADKLYVRAVGGLQSWDQVLPGRGFTSTGQCYFSGNTLTEAQANPECNYDRQFNGNNGLLDSNGQPFTFCPFTVDGCTARWGDSSRILAAGKVLTESSIIGSGRNKSVSTSVSNEARLRNLHLGVPVGRIKVYNPRLIGMRPEYNPARPDEGTLVTEWIVGEGRARALRNIKVMNRSMPRSDGRGLVVRLGEYRQQNTGFTANSINHSRSILFRADLNPIDPRFIEPDQVTAEVEIEGKEDWRIYAADGSYTEAYTENASDVGINLLTDERFGLRYPLDRIPLSSIVNGRAAAERVIEFTDDRGDVRQFKRSQFNGFLETGQARDVLREFCQTMMWKPPQESNGQLRWGPLDAEVLDSRIPVFSDEGSWGQRNVISENGRSTLQIVQKTSDAELINEVLIDMQDAGLNFVRRTINVRDERQQEKAAQKVGQRARLKREKQYPGYGIINDNQAIWYGMMMRDLGPFRSGGIRNNWEATFLTPAWWPEALELAPFTIIRIVSSRAAGLIETTGRPFEYWQVMNIQAERNHACKVTAIAYPVDYIATMEKIAPVSVPNTLASSGQVFTVPFNTAEYGVQSPVLTV